MKFFALVVAALCSGCATFQTPKPTAIVPVAVKTCVAVSRPNFIDPDKAQNMAEWVERIEQLTKEQRAHIGTLETVLTNCMKD